MNGNTIPDVSYSTDENLRGLRVLHLAAADSMLNPNMREQLLFLRRIGCDVHTASIDGPLAKRLHEQDGFPWTPLPLSREFAPLSDLRAVRFVEKFCRSENFDIVHTHTPKGNLVGQWGARLGGTKIVLQTLHGFYFHDRMSPLPRRAWIEIEKFSAGFSDHVLCQNPEDVETALREGIVASGKISELGNGIDLRRFAPVSAEKKALLRKTLNLPATARVIGMVGRFVREKGFHDFVAAAEIIAKDYPDVYFLAIGHQLASERNSQQIAVNPAGRLKDRLIVLTDRDDMPELYACMDIHVLPSHREGFPRALIEGAAMGLPQVATNIRGCRQVIQNDINGFLVQPENPEMLATRIKILLDDFDLCGKMSAETRLIAVAQFDQERVFQRLKNCYFSLLK